MVKDYSLDALNRFLDYALEKGLLKSETAKSRKTAVNKILEKITDEQRADVRKIDLDLEADHFANRQGAGYIPASLQTYKSRARTALADFEAYVDNPMTFKPAGANNGNFHLVHPQASLRSRLPPCRGQHRSPGRASSTVFAGGALACGFALWLVEIVKKLASSPGR